MKCNDLVVLVIVSIDNQKRQRNYDYLKRYFKDNSIPGVFIENPTSDYLHLQKIYNDFCKENFGKIVIRQDVDCILNIQNIKKGYDILKQNPKTLLYPFNKVNYIDPAVYSSCFDDYSKYDIIRVMNNWPSDFTLKQLVDYIIGNREYFVDLNLVNFSKMSYASPLGYSFMVNVDEYFKIGLDNEHLLDYNFEDLERYERARKLGFDCVHLPGVAYHMDHSDGHLGAKVRSEKGYIIQNTFEYLKVLNLNCEELTKYVKKWPWIQN